MIMILSSTNPDSKQIDQNEKKEQSVKNSDERLLGEECHDCVRNKQNHSHKRQNIFKLFLSFHLFTSPMDEWVLRLRRKYNARKKGSQPNAKRTFIANLCFDPLRLRQV